MTSIKPTDEMVRAFMRAYAAADDGSSQVILNDAAEKAGIAAVLGIFLRGVALPGEPVWTGSGRKSLTLEMESSHQIEEVNLGEADRPSEVARLLRRAADDIEAAFFEVTAHPARLASGETT